MDVHDEPVLGPTSRDQDANEKNEEPLADRIRRLVTTQPYGVLCTHGDQHAYGSLIAFAFSSDLRHAVFATPSTTRKYRLLSEHDRVALVVHDASGHSVDMMQAEAITATGQARQLEPGPLFDESARLLLARHPQLETFIQAESVALFQIDIFRFLHVSRFQEVQQWTPAR